jgi:protein-S-isoprenylcysteine O-methyltransferase Ste14
MLFNNPKCNLVWEKSANVALALIFGTFLYNFAIDLAVNIRVSTFIMVTYESMLVYFLLTRSMPIGVSTRTYDWFISIAGTWIPLLMRPGMGFNEHIGLLSLQIVGLTISAFGLYTLSKSFGIVAANRGVKTGGIYSLVRHPLYTGYLISIGCYALQNPSDRNFVCYGILVVFTVLRVLGEEKYLAKDADYRIYMEKTGWRLLPYVW